LEDRRNVGESSCNSGDRTDQRVQSLITGMSMVQLRIHLDLYNLAEKGSWENLYRQMYQQQGKLIMEQQTHEHSALYELALAPIDIHDSRQLHGTQMGTR